MKTFFSLALVSAAAAYAQDTTLSPAPEASTTPTELPAEAPATAAEVEEQLSPGERRIRAGIVLLGMLHNTLARIHDTETANEAVPSIMKLARELQLWGQGFAALPPLDEDTQSEYEKRYLPIINRLNEQIQIQAERISAAEFYGSENLPAALVHLVNSVQ